MSPSKVPTYFAIYTPLCFLKTFRMKSLVLPLMLQLIAGAAFANADDPYRTFTDDQGRTVEAVIVRTSPDKVWIRRDDGRTFQVATSTFSEADRKYISEWRQMNALEDPDAIEFSSKRYTDERRTESRNYATFKIDRFGYIIAITNTTVIDLENLDVEYRYYAKRGTFGETGQDRQLEGYGGRATIASLPSRETTEIKTDSVTLKSTKLKRGFSYTNTNQRRTNDSLGGVWVRIKQDGELIAEFSSPSRLKTKEDWNRVSYSAK